MLFHIYIFGEGTITDIEIRDGHQLCLVDFNNPDSNIKIEYDIHLKMENTGVILLRNEWLTPKSDSTPEHDLNHIAMAINYMIVRNGGTLLRYPK